MLKYKPMADKICDTHGRGHLRRWSGRTSALDRAERTSMSEDAATGHEGPVNVPDAQSVVDETAKEVYPHYNPETGTGRVPVPSGDPVDGDVEHHGGGETEARLSVSGEWFDEGAPPRVHATVFTDTATTRLSMSPERARELSHELALAAMHAEQGDAEAGESND